MVRCKRGLGQFQLTWNTQADAEPADHPRHQGRAARRSVRDVPRQARVDAAAEGRRAPGQRVRRLDPAADRRADRRVEVRAQGGPGVPGPARPRRRLLPPARRRRAAAGLRRGRRAASSRWVEKVARAADADHAAQLAKFTLSDKVPFLVTGASGSLGRAVVQAAARRRAIASACSCAGIPEQPQRRRRVRVRQPRRSGRGRSRGRRAPRP